jgi:hypothetical protein
MKKTTRELKEKPSNASTAGERISIAFAEYRPVATRGALLYFLIVDMAAINVMYHLSLQQFLGLFDFSLAHSAPAPVAAKRIIMIIDFADFHVTSYVQRGLFVRVDGHLVADAHTAHLDHRGPSHRRAAEDAPRRRRFARRQRREAEAGLVDLRSGLAAHHPALALGARVPRSAGRDHSQRRRVEALVLRQSAPSP